MTEVLLPTEEALAKAGELIRAGEVVGFPTETVYGLGADATNSEAIAKVFAAKGRPGDNPLIVHISDLSQIGGIIKGEMNENAKKLAAAYWPGPMTMIFPKAEGISEKTTAGLDSVGVRFPSHPVAQAFITAARRPIAAPSANLSGKPSPTTAKHVLSDMDGRIPLIIDGGASGVGVESTVIDVCSKPVRILRPGGITPQMVADVLGEVEVDGSVLRPIREGEIVRSPGMKYKHYAPNGSLVIVRGDENRVAEKINALYDATEGKRCILALDGHRELYGSRRTVSLGANPAEAAQRLFDVLREMDDLNVNAMFSEAVEADGIGLAVMNRLGRAAAFHIIDANSNDNR